MLKLSRKQDCSGCTACASVCPKHCIEMRPDSEGFLYPVVDENTCINCGLCNNICPVLNQSEPRQPLHCYAAKNKNKDVLLKSSSGGVFSLLAQYIIAAKNGAVFGAMWENERVVHGFIESTDELYKLRGSKYVQSDLKDSFHKVSMFLKAGRHVLFSGTPCEIAGLKSYLRKDYENLLTVDLACHGTPSPKVLSMYIKELKDKYGVDSLFLNFRDKSTGWSTYSVSAYSGDTKLFSELASKNIYMRGFLRELYSRPSCHACSFKSFRSGSDITLADFWGIEEVLPEFYSADGASLIITHSTKAESLIHRIDSVVIKGVELEKVICQNGSLLHSEEPHPERTYFYKHIDEDPFVELMKKCIGLRRITRLKLTLKAYIIKLGIK